MIEKFSSPVGQTADDLTLSHVPKTGLADLTGVMLDLRSRFRIQAAPQY